MTRREHYTLTTDIEHHILTTDFEDHTDNWQEHHALKTNYTLTTDIKHYILTTDREHYTLTTDREHYTQTTDREHYILTTDREHYILITDIEHYTLTTDREHHIVTTRGEWSYNWHTGESILAPADDVAWRLHGAVGSILAHLWTQRSQRPGSLTSVPIVKCQTSETVPVKSTSICPRNMQTGRHTPTAWKRSKTYINVM